MSSEEAKQVEATYEDFLKLDIRVGTITSAERVPKSEKLLQLQVNFGELGVRTILAGIGKDFDPTLLSGKQIVAVVNLAPRKMMGIMSHGMILAGHHTEGLSLVSCSGVPDGVRLG